MDLEDCLQITDATLTNLNVGCPNLTSMSLSHCENLTDTSLAELCASHKDRLQVLELDNCPNITDAALDYMMPLYKLERIDLYDCQQITKEAIKKFKVRDLLLPICNNRHAYTERAARSGRACVLRPSHAARSCATTATGDLSMLCDSLTLFTRRRSFSLCFTCPDSNRSFPFTEILYMMRMRALYPLSSLLP